ncbi:MAG TPA: nitrate reductase associated protein [bacterium]
MGSLRTVFNHSVLSPFEGTIVFRKFNFEEEIRPKVGYVPLATRYKLDIVGLRLPKKSWSVLAEEEREVLCHLSVRSQGEKECYRRYLAHLLAKRGERPEFLDPSEIQQERNQWENPILIPVSVRRKMQEAGLSMVEEEWLKMDDLERYVLFRLSKENGSADPFQRALQELREHPRPRRFSSRAS